MECFMIARVGGGGGGGGQVCVFWSGSPLPDHFGNHPPLSFSTAGLKLFQHLSKDAHAFAETFGEQEYAKGMDYFFLPKKYVRPI